MATSINKTSSRVRRKATMPVAVVGQARAQKTRDAILRAATRVFSRHGFAGGKIEQISKLSRTHDRMIYYYFGSKERLFVEVLETAYARMNDAEAELAFDLNDPEEALTTVVHFVWQYYLDHPEMITLLNSENLQQGKHIRKSARVSKLSSPAVEVLDQVLAAGVKKGLFRHDVSARDLYIEIAALGYFYLSNRFTLSAFLNVDLRSAENLAHWKAFITDVTLRSVRQMSAGTMHSAPFAEGKCLVSVETPSS
ncbi:MAG TPA: TetR family transcriptional regulator [Pusillimonas sp.]|jgi:AcrR family transcriptional regulator|nr:TetR family transcriptional regulator [Pusillimonas sp.]MBC41146.1 TetR family transcriptional regulator [Pusillimonas sp.]HBT33075.1 TetR family transcriptional regulator [Pusillimonas sp.]HCP79883.1 TetR family transcriptional regulator [Pusillimonas sp.]|tara:strand:- start:87869 stop:88627 length:759 start_codon:yes stop_codon:yes gene_type:complete